MSIKIAKMLPLSLAGLLMLALLTAQSLLAADHIQINPHLDYNSDSADGPLITGQNMESGIVAGKPNYILLYREQCFNSKRQARRTVALYRLYKTRVHFVIIALDHPPSAAQQELTQKYARGFIPQVTILDGNGVAVYDRAGEVDTLSVEKILDKALR